MIKMNDKTLLEQIKEDDKYKKIISVASQNEKEVIEKTIQDFAEQMEKNLLKPLKDIFNNEETRKKVQIELLKKLEKKS